MKDYLNIGVIVKPQGIKGEVKVIPMTDDAQRFRKLKQVIIGDTEYTVAGVKIAPDAVFVAIGGINDRNTAELLRGKYLSVRREDAVKLQEGRYFICDLENADVYFEDGSLFGKVVEITKAKTDYFTVKTTSGKIARFPFLKSIIDKVEVENLAIYLIKEKFLEVVCYED